MDLNNVMTHEPPARSAMRSPTLLVFLGYEGTLERAHTPPFRAVNSEVVELLSRLRDEPHTRLAIVSGLPLDDLRRLIGVRSLIDGREGFRLEETASTISIDAEAASDIEARFVLSAMRRLLREMTGSGEGLRMVQGRRFMKIAPYAAHKGRTVEHMLRAFQEPQGQIVYVGGDARDEEAFLVVRKHGGVCVRVGHGLTRTRAQYCLETPADVRCWLASLCARDGQDSSPNVRFL